LFDLYLPATTELTTEIHTRQKDWKTGSALRYFVRFYWLKGENFAGVLKKDM